MACALRLRARPLSGSPVEARNGPGERVRRGGAPRRVRVAENRSGQQTIAAIAFALAVIAGTGRTGICGDFKFLVKTLLPMCNQEYNNQRSSWIASIHNSACDQQETRSYLY